MNNGHDVSVIAGGVTGVFSQASDGKCPAVLIGLLAQVQLTSMQASACSWGIV